MSRMHEIKDIASIIPFGGGLLQLKTKNFNFNNQLNHIGEFRYA
jgi:hypothetical protein